MAKKKPTPKPMRAAPPKRPAVKSPTARTAAADPDASEVREFLKSWKHPLRRELELVREILLGASPRVRECIQWNTLTFRTTDPFATLNGPRHTDAVMIVFHTGAKAKGIALRKLVEDPAGLLDWRGPERALVTFEDATDVRANRTALGALVRSWLKAQGVT